MGGVGRIENGEWRTGDGAAAAYAIPLPLRWSSGEAGEGAAPPTRTCPLPTSAGGVHPPLDRGDEVVVSGNGIGVGADMIRGVVDVSEV